MGRKKQLYIYFKQQTGEIALKKLEHGYEKVSQGKNESLLKEVQNNTIKITLKQKSMIRKRIEIVGYVKTEMKIV